MEVETLLGSMMSTSTNQERLDGCRCHAGAAAAARRHKLSWHVMMALVKTRSDLMAEHHRSRRCRVDLTRFRLTP